LGKTNKCRAKKLIGRLEFIFLWTKPKSFIMRHEAKKIHWAEPTNGEPEE